MKKIVLATIIFVIVLVFSKVVIAQTDQPKLNQIELMKQWTGTWECRISKDSANIWELKSFGSGYELDYKFSAKGIVYHEIKDLWVYDIKLNKWICFSLQKNGVYDIFYGSFTSKDNLVWEKFELVDPRKIIEIWVEEFPSSDSFILYKKSDGGKTFVSKFNRLK